MYTTTQLLQDTVKKIEERFNRTTYKIKTPQRESKIIDKYKSAGMI